MQIMIVM